MSPSLQEILLVTITGTDRPGITTRITGVLAQHGVTVLDMGQSVIHHSLNLGFLLYLPPKQQSTPVVKELLYLTHQMEMTVSFTPVTIDEYNLWVNEQGKSRYIISLLARSITARQLSETTRIISRQGLNIDMIHRLSGRIPMDGTEHPSRACIEMSVRGTPEDEAGMKQQFMELSQELALDIAFQQDDIYRRNRRLVCFDMDSTLIQTEVIDELAERASVGEQVRDITRRAMEGHLDFQESLTQRVALLKGLHADVIQEIASTLPITEGAYRLISTLKQYGYRTAIISGGFTCFGKSLQQKLGIDHVYANNLEIIDNRLTGNLNGPIVDGPRKAKIMNELAFSEMINLKQVIAVGDGANDLPMLSQAGLGIAFHAKPLVKESAEQSISTLGLDAILYLLGFRDRDVVHDLEK